MTYSIKHYLVGSVAWLAIVSSVYVYTQPAPPSTSITWTQDAPTAADAAKYTYRIYIDNSTIGINLTGVTCTSQVNNVDEACTAPAPSIKPGVHTITMSATNASGEGPKSDPPVQWTVLVVQTPPPAPKNIQIK